MKATLRALFVCVLMAPAVASAQGSIQGQWAGEIQGDTPQRVQMSIGVDADSIHGSIIGSQGDELSMQEASITGNIVEFFTIVRDGGTETKFLWSGTINGDEITFTCIDENKQGAAIDLVVTRQPPLASN